MLDELVKGGHIRAKTKWKTVYPLFAEDERYLNLLGTPGSNPIELFWDVVDQFDQALEEKVSRVNRAMDAKGIKFSVSLTSDGLRDAIRGSEEIEGLSDKDVAEVYETVSPHISPVVLLLTLNCSSKKNLIKRLLRNRGKPSGASGTKSRIFVALLRKWILLSGWIFRTNRYVMIRLRAQLGLKF